MKEDAGLQGMRGWSALLIMCFHIIGYVSLPFIAVFSFMNSGYSAVYFFFLISGYILMRKFESKDYNIKGKFNVLIYYMRRIFRIWPLYFIAIFLFAYQTKVIWQEFLFIQNYLPSTFSFSALWTLVIEELFYLILPLWVLAFHKDWLKSFIAIMCFSIAYMLIVTIFFSSGSPNYLYAQFPTFAITYALGTLLAKGKAVKVHWILIALAWLILSVYFSYDGAQFSFVAVILFSLVYFLVLSNLRNSVVFTNRIMHFIGGLTYPIYLVSVPVEYFLIATIGTANIFWIPLTFILTITSAYFLHVTIEKPLIGVGSHIESIVN